MRTFDEIAKAQDWDAEAQRDVLREFVVIKAEDEALAEFAETVVDAEEAILAEGDTDEPDDSPVVDADGDADATTD